MASLFCRAYLSHLQKPSCSQSWYDIRSSNTFWHPGADKTRSFETMLGRTGHDLTT